MHIAWSRALPCGNVGLKGLELDSETCKVAVWVSMTWDKRFTSQGACSRRERAEFPHTPDTLIQTRPCTLAAASPSFLSLPHPSSLQEQRGHMQEQALSPSPSVTHCPIRMLLSV